MAIIASIVKSSTPQANGTLLVHEQHTDTSGIIHDVIYTANVNDDIELTCQTRGQNISAELVAKENALAEATNYEIPLTDMDVMKRLTPQEWDAFQNHTDINIAYFRAIFNRAKVIYRNDPLTQAGIAALVATNILTAERAAEVFA